MEHIDAPDDLVGHATAILTRLGGLTYSPASTLLGKQFGGRDPYWAAEGVKMATAALGIALLLQLQKERARIFDKEGRLRERLHVDVDAWNKVDPPPGNTEDKETLAIARTRAAADVRRTLEMCADTAGISALTAEAARYIKRESRWLDRLTERYRESARDLRSHGFVTDRLRDGGALVHEIRGWSFKAYDLDVHLEWRIDDAHDVSSTPWGAVQLPVDVDTLGEEFERMKDTLRECGPPLATMGTRGEREDFEFRDYSSSVAMASVPALHRDPEVANDCERLLVIMDVADGIGRRDAARDRPGELARMERKLLEGLRDLRERFDPDREATPDPSSWVLMTALHTAWWGSRDSFIGARCGYNVECDDGTDEWKFEELPPAESLAEYGEDDCGHRLPDYPEITALQWYEDETGRSAAIATTCAIRHAKELRTMVEDFGILLCGILLKDEEKGTAEWERRIQEKVRRRAELVTAVLKACQDLRDRASENKCVLLQQPLSLMIDRGALFENESIAEGMERGERSYRMHLESYEKDNRHVNEDGHVRSGVSVVGLADLIVKEGFRGDVVKAWPQWLKQLKAAIAESNAVEPPGFEELERNIAFYATLSGPGTTGQYYGALGTARDCFRGFSDERAARTLYFGCEPFWQSVMVLDPGRVIRFGEYLDRDDQTIFVVQPDLREGADLMGKTLKALFFESVLMNKDRERAGHTLPLVAYVADEFHRFITADRLHGEQSFLDTCRSFGVCCVLACQSTASMEYALGLQTGESEVRSAVSIILNNTGTKLFFRTTDAQTKATLREIAPLSGRPGMPSAVDVRPPSTLAPGECYAVVVDGRFVRVQLDWWRPSEKETTRRARVVEPSGEADEGEPDG